MSEPGLSRKEKERVIPFTSIQDVVYTPPTAMRLACLQLITKEMPDVKKSYWYAYENNLVVVHPSTEELAPRYFCVHLVQIQMIANRPQSHTV